jgi:hypothetical protein
MMSFQKLLFEARRQGKGKIDDKRTPQLSWSVAFQEDEIE